MANTMVSLQMKVGEKDALVKGAEKEKRSLSNYLLYLALNHTKEQHGIEPEKEEE